MCWFGFWIALDIGILLGLWLGSVFKGGGK